MNLRPLVVAIFIGIAISACAESGVSESDYEALVDAQGSLEAEIETAQTQLGVATAKSEALLTERDEAIAEVSDLAAENDALQAELAQAQSAQSESAAAASAAQTELEALLLKYDGEIRLELEADIAEEVGRACGQAKEEYDRSVATIVSWSPKWEALTTRAVLIQEVEECSAAERSKSVEQREADRLSACETVDVDELEKNPDAYRDECIRMWVYIVQYDTNTGVCTFRGEMAAKKRSRWYDYDGNALFSAANDSACPELDGIDNNDFVEMWATGNGTISYDTQAGGTATATVWRIEKIDLWRKG